VLRGHAHAGCTHALIDHGGRRVDAPGSCGRPVHETLTYIDAAAVPPVAEDMLTDTALSAWPTWAPLSLAAASFDRRVTSAGGPGRVPHRPGQPQRSAPANLVFARPGARLLIDFDLAGPASGLGLPPPARGGPRHEDQDISDSRSGRALERGEGGGRGWGCWVVRIFLLGHAVLTGRPPQVSEGGGGNKDGTYAIVNEAATAGPSGASMTTGACL